MSKWKWIEMVKSSSGCRTETSNILTYRTRIKKKKLFLTYSFPSRIHETADETGGTEKQFGTNCP
jgi:nitrogenase molybdenum-iron protein alpha/beta subunit